MTTRIGIYPRIPLNILINGILLEFESIVGQVVIDVANINHFICNSALRQ